MSCLCHKLLTGQYHNITEGEAKTLRRTWAEAPHLFQVNPPTPPDTEDLVARGRGKKSASGSVPRARKRLRMSSASSSNSLIPDQTSRQPSKTISMPSLSPTAINLVKSYSYPNAVKVVGSGDGLDLQRSGSSSTFVEVFLAIERSDRNIEIQQLFRRTCYYAFAQLHEKRTSVDLIVQEIKNALPLASGTKQKVYHILRLGSKWTAIVEQFGSIANRASKQLTGLLCLLGSASAWERASIEDQRSALATLYSNTDIFERTEQFTPFVARVLDQIFLEHSFVDETPILTSHSMPVLAMPMFQSSRSGVKPTTSKCRTLHTVSEEQPMWKAPSLAAVSQTIPGSNGIHSEDANILLVFLSFLSTSEKVPLDLLLRGATPRRRWTVQGEIVEVDAVVAGLVPEMSSLLSNISRLVKAFLELEVSSTVSKSEQIYTLDETIACRVRESLPPEHISFWRRQALIVAYRAIPWKYIEPAISVTKLFLPHLKHALQAFQDGLKHLPESTRVDLILTLVEASRFPKMEWKNFVIAQANIGMLGIKDQYLRSRIAQSECLLYRLAGDMNRAVGALGKSSETGPSNGTDKRMHSAIGLTAVQHALNGIQVEDLSTAEESLEDWTPLGQSTSPMEITVLFRKHMMLGKILRFGGRFKESLAHLEKSLNLVHQQKDLEFNEDLRDLICDLADTLRELDDAVSAEHHLRTEIGTEKPELYLSPGKSLLELSLAEALFCQERFKEAENLCLDIQSRPGLLKFEKLRLCITLAKLRHVNSDDEGAFAHWANAMVAISRFPIETGGTTRIIITSICDILNRQGRRELLDQSLEQLASLDRLARPGNFWYWIAGLQHWLEYLQSRSLRSRM